MQKIDDKILEFINDLEYEPAKNMFLNVSTGKKLRSKLIYKIAGENDKSTLLSAVIELIHLASLLHDDVIDESSTRRGRASINAQFGAKNAIMLGDIFYSKGFNEIVKFDKQIADIVSNAVCKLSIGELMDVNLGESFNHNKEKYLKMIYFKTAVLIEASAKTAAILANKDPKIYANYGKNLGLAFQIIDDILDIVSDDLTLGKPSMHDFKEGKTTLPYIYLYEVLNDDDKKNLLFLFKKDLNDDEINWLKNKFNEFNIIEKTKKEAIDLGLKAMENLQDEALLDIVKSMINRDF